jgi:hypothetical protein
VGCKEGFDPSSPGSQPGILPLNYKHHLWEQMESHHPRFPICFTGRPATTYGNILPFHILRFAYYVKLHYVTYNKLTRQGMILRPSHYECDATNQLSYGSMCYHSTIVRMILARESISPVNAIAFHILLFLISSLFALTSLLHVSVEYSLPPNSFTA